MTKFTAKILASSRERLERCSYGDLARLCSACATTALLLPLNVRDRNLFFNYFPRGMVRILNDKSYGQMINLAPRELVDLIWALGELGVTSKSRNADSGGSMSDEFQLTSELSTLSSDQLKDLSPYLISRLVR